jgi:uncharacterized protein
MGKQEILEILRNYKAQYAEKYGIRTLGVFGSVARETAREDSDVDVVVYLEKPDLFALAGIKEDLEEKTHKRVDIVAYRDKMNRFLKTRIDKEAVYV